MKATKAADERGTEIKGPVVGVVAVVALLVLGSAVVSDPGNRQFGLLYLFGIAVLALVLVAHTRGQLIVKRPSLPSLTG